MAQLDEADVRSIADVLIDHLDSFIAEANSISLGSTYLDFDEAPTRQRLKEAIRASVREKPR
jgi:hypothetical protein